MVKKKRTVKAKRTESAKEESSKKIPVGVQIISVFPYYVGGVFCMLVGLLILIFAGGIASFFADQSPELLGVITSGVIAGLGILLALFGVLTFFVGRGLWKLKPWARIVAILLGIVAGIYAIYGMIKTFAIMQVINLAISAAIVIYLIVNKEVKRAFK